MYKRKDGLWADSIATADGNRHKYFYGKTKSEVKRKIAEYVAACERSLTFEAAADAWDNSHSLVVAYNTNSSYRAPLSRSKEYFKGVPLASITPDQAQAFINYIAAQGFARRTVQLHKDMMKQIFDHAMTQPGSSIKFNVFTPVKIPKGLSKTRRMPPTDEQIAVVVGAGNVDEPEEMALFAYFLLFTGLRRGELLGLKWSDIDRNSKRISVRRSVYYEVNSPKIKETKTDAGNRVVDIVDALANALPPDGVGYVFGGEQPWTKSAFQKRWVKFCRAIGCVTVVEKRHKAKNNQYISHEFKPTITPHQFRHAFASILDDAGIDEVAAKATLGHASIVTTKDVYTHLRSLKRNSIAPVLNEYISHEIVKST